MKHHLSSSLLGIALAVGLTTSIYAADLVRVASSQKGLWDQTMIQFGKDKGIFSKHNINLEILWTDGGADAQQAVIAGSMDVAVGTGMLGIISAWSKGAPVTIISASMTGSSDLFWYTKADSKIGSFADTAGKTVAFSRPGSSTNLIAASLVAAAGTNAKLAPTGGLAATMTQVMSGQIDVGWSAVPVGLDREARGEIKIIASGNDAPGVKNQTVRVHIANTNFLKKNPDVVKRFLAAYQETLQWAYSTDEALKMWADMNRLDMKAAKAARDRGYAREALQLFPVKGIDLSIKEAVENKRLKEPLSKQQATDLLATSVQFEKTVK